MLDMSVPWQQPIARPTRSGALWRGIAMALRAASPITIDPTPGLIEPALDAAHTATRVSIPLGEDFTPGWLFEPKQPSGATVCLAHGTTAEKPLCYFGWIHALLAAGARVLTFELDGHGDNPRPLSCPGIDDNVPAALAFLRARPGIDPDRIGLLGVSMGGACALNAAASDPRVKAVVTVSTPFTIAMDEWSSLGEALTTFNPEVLPVLVRATPNKLLEWMTSCMRVAQTHQHAPDEIDFLDPRCGDVIARTLRYLNPLDSAARLTNTPVLVINGEWDNIVPPYQALDLYERVPGPKALTLVPRRNHLTVMLSRQAIDASVHWFRRWL